LVDSVENNILAPSDTCSPCRGYLIGLHMLMMLLKAMFELKKFENENGNEKSF
jgi:hypothetical protein